MPELHFDVRWPDGTVERCYSPSRSVMDFLEVGTSYPLAEFVGRSRSALELAGERVRMRYGFACSGAAEQLERIEQRARAFDGARGEHVTVVGFAE